MKARFFIMACKVLYDLNTSISPLLTSSTCMTLSSVSVPPDPPFPLPPHSLSSSHTDFLVFLEYASHTPNLDCPLPPLLFIFTARSLTHTGLYVKDMMQKHECKSIHDAFDGHQYLNFNPPSLILQIFLLCFIFSLALPSFYISYNLYIYLV